MKYSDAFGADAVYERFRDRLLMVMRRNGMTVQTFAEACGVSRFTVGGWLHKGQMPNGYSLYLVCNAFGVSANWLLGLDERR